MSFGLRQYTQRWLTTSMTCPSLDHGTVVPPHTQSLRAMERSAAMRDDRLLVTLADRQVPIVVMMVTGNDLTRKRDLLGNQ